MRFLPALAVSALAAAITTCRSSTAPTSALEGAWTADLPSSQAVISLHLAVADTVVTGSGVLGSLTDIAGLPLTVHGTFLAPNASLSLDGAGIAMTFVGSVSGSALTGTLNGGSYTNLAVTFNKV